MDFPLSSWHVMAGQEDSSELDRVSFYANSWEGIEKNPEGHGLGGFASEFGVAEAKYLSSCTT
jgi:hypothetical protein